MSERIEWSDTETRVYRCWLRVVRCWEVTPGRIGGQTEGAATVDDLRRACEAAGLELVDQSWPLVGDLVMESHVLSSQLMRAGLAECDRLRAQHAEDLEKLGREMNEVVAQRDAARDSVERARELLGADRYEPLPIAARRVVAERDEARACYLACAQAVGITYETDGRAPEAGPMDVVLGAIRAAVKGAAERDELRARAEKAEAELEAARASASLVTMVGDIGVRNSGDATRLEAILAERDAAIARAEKAEALHAEAEGQIACRNELRARIAEEAYESVRDLGLVASRAMAYAAVARHVRAERPACLVARAVALGVDVRVAEDRCGWLVGMLESAYLDEVIERDIPAADVPATLARLLDEVEAARKGGAK